LSGKQFHDDGAATAKARFARCLCVLGITYAVALDNASDYQASGLLSDYIEWTKRLSD